MKLLASAQNLYTGPDAVSHEVANYDNITVEETIETIGISLIFYAFFHSRTFGLYKWHFFASGGRGIFDIVLVRALIVFLPELKLFLRSSFPIRVLTLKFVGMFVQDSASFRWES